MAAECWDLFSPCWYLLTLSYYGWRSNRQRQVDSFHPRGNHQGQRWKVKKWYVFSHNPMSEALLIPSATGWKPFWAGRKCFQKCQKTDSLLRWVIPFPVNHLIWHKAIFKFSHYKPLTSSDLFEAYSNDIRTIFEGVPKQIRLYPYEYTCISEL